MRVHLLESFLLNTSWPGVTTIQLPRVPNRQMWVWCNVDGDMVAIGVDAELRAFAALSHVSVFPIGVPLQVPRFRESGWREPSLRLRCNGQSLDGRPSIVFVDVHQRTPNADFLEWDTSIAYADALMRVGEAAGFRVGMARGVSCATVEESRTGSVDSIPPFGVLSVVSAQLVWEHLVLLAPAATEQITAKERWFVAAFAAMMDCSMEPVARARQMLAIAQEIAAAEIGAERHAAFMMMRVAQELAQTQDPVASELAISAAREAKSQYQRFEWSAALALLQKSWLTPLLRRTQRV